MESKWYKKRTTYNDPEIAIMIKNKLEKEHMSKEEFLSIYLDKYEDLTMEVVDYMLDGSVFYDITMLEIAADFLNIEFERLTEIIEDSDEVDYRSSTDEDVEDFGKIINILFSEMIENIKMSGENCNMEIGK